MSKLITPQECLVRADQAESNLFTHVTVEVRRGPLARYGNYQEVISRRHKQMYTSSDTRLEWPGEGPLFESDSNKPRGPKTELLFASPLRPLLKSGLQPLGRYFIFV